MTADVKARRTPLSPPGRVQETPTPQYRERSKKALMRSPRVCLQCGAPLSVRMRSHAKYCGDSCRVMACCDRKIAALIENDEKQRAVQVWRRRFVR